MWANDDDKETGIIIPIRSHLFPCNQWVNWSPSYNTVAIENIAISWFIHPQYRYVPSAIIHNITRDDLPEENTNCVVTIAVEKCIWHGICVFAIKIPIGRTVCIASHIDRTSKMQKPMKWRNYESFFQGTHHSFRQYQITTKSLILINSFCAPPHNIAELIALVFYIQVNVQDEEQFYVLHVSTWLGWCLDSDRLIANEHSTTSDPSTYVTFSADLQLQLCLCFLNSISALACSCNLML